VSRLAAALLALAVSVSCASSADNAPAVASVSVALSPSQASIGSPVEMQYRLEALPGAAMPHEPQVVFVHAVDASGRLLWTDDHHPLVPVDRWQTGTPVEYSRTMFVPRVAVSGPVELRVGVYNPTTGARLKLSNGSADDARTYPAATLNVRPDPEAVFVAYTEGWHNPESSDAMGRDWRWSKKLGRLAFRNPRRAAELWLEVDQPVAGATPPQQLQVVVGGTVLDTFSLDGQSITIHRTRLTPDVLGGGDTVDLDLVPARSFVPADIPSLKNTDRRELGVRVFNAYIALR
jgi:hypothetical protein